VTAFVGSLLRYVDDNGRQQEFELSPERQRITIGRSPQADVSLSWDAEVSRLHALRA